MEKLEISQMENLQGEGQPSKACQYLTGIFCGGTVVLAFSGVFAPLAGATAVGCGAGLASGCY